MGSPITFEIDIAAATKYGSAASFKARKPSAWPPNTWTTDVPEGLDVVVDDVKTFADQLQLFRKLDGWADMDEATLRDAAGSVCQLIYMGVHPDTVRTHHPAGCFSCLCKAERDASFLNPSRPSLMTVSCRSNRWRPRA